MNIRVCKRVRVCVCYSEFWVGDEENVAKRDSIVTANRRFGNITIPTFESTTDDCEPFLNLSQAQNIEHQRFWN